MTALRTGSGTGDGPDVGNRCAEYTTLRAGCDVRHELVLKRSRFLTVLRRVDTEDAARELVVELRREFADAGHHCSAFVLGPERSIQRASDDGEPSGTAGAPMLQALLRRDTAPAAGLTGAGGAGAGSRPGTGPTADLSDVCAVVVRYFGGVLLGTGGLMRAYTESVNRALDAAPLLRRKKMRLYAVPVGHATAGRVENELRAAGIAVLGSDYDAEKVLLRIALPDGGPGFAGVPELLAGGSAAGAEFQSRGVEWVDAD